MQPAENPTLGTKVYADPCFTAAACALFNHVEASRHKANPNTPARLWSGLSEATQGYYIAAATNSAVAYGAMHQQLYDSYELLHVRLHGRNLKENEALTEA